MLAKKMYCFELLIKKSGTRCIHINDEIKLTGSPPHSKLTLSPHNYFPCVKSWLAIESGSSIEASLSHGHVRIETTLIFQKSIRSEFVFFSHFLKIRDQKTLMKEFIFTRVDCDFYTSQSSLIKLRPVGQSDEANIQEENTPTLA